MPNYVAGVGPLEPNLMIVGEAPGKHEDEQGKPFVGPSGAMLDDYLFRAGINRSSVYITNVVKYRPPYNDMSKLHLIDVDLDKSAEELWRNEIELLHPKCILAVGSYAMRAVMGWPLAWDKKKDNYKITDYRGSILLARNNVTKVVPTIHPAALMTRFTSDSEEATGGLDYVYSKLIQADIRRAVDESKTRELLLPERTLDITHSSLDLYRFIEQYKKLEKAAVDIESINCIPVCVGFAFSRQHAISVPLLKNIGKHQLTDMGDNELNECWRLIYQQLESKKLIGHNFKYDDFKLSLAGFDCKTVYSDTLIKTRVLFPELPDKRLCTVASLWTREPYYKDEGKEFKFGKSPTEQLFKYNAKDCAVEFEVDEKQENDLVSMAERYHVPLVDYYYNYMMKKHKFYLNMENNGFNVDHDKQRELHKRYTELQNTSHSKLIELVGHEVNVKSPPQIYQLLYKEMKFKTRKIAPTSEDAIVALMGSHCKGKDGQAKKEILEEILQERRIRDQKSRYINFVPDYDGRCKTSFNISATETCRSSTSVLKKPLRPKKLGLAFHTISKHGDLAKDIRSMFIPDPGKVFIQADASQCQARIVAVLATDWELLEAFDKIDIHRRTAGLAFGLVNNLILTTARIPLVDELEKDGPERFTGKKLRHAGNFDMKERRFKTEFNTDAQKFGIKMEVSEWKAKQMLDLFHAASPKLRSVFHRDIRDALDSDRTLIDPFGGVRIFNGRQDEDLYKEGYANIPQRTEAHLIQGAALAITEELGDDIVSVQSAKLGANWLSENHDSLLMQVPENNWEPYAKLMKKHMTAPIDFSRYCTLKRDYILTIPCDVELSETNYAEMTKVKV